MIASLLRRLFLISVTLLVLSFVSYAILMRDPLNQALAEPHFYSGYLYYIKMLSQGDLGITYNGGDALYSLILTVLPPTLELCFVAMLLSCLFGIPLGLLGALNSRNLFGKSISAVTSLGISLPVFWLAPILLYVAALYQWEIAAIGQFNLLYEIPQVTGFAIIDVWMVEQPYRIKIVQSVLQHLVLPTLILAISPTMEIARIIQQRAQYVFQQNYVKVSVTRGWSTLKILRKFVLRNTLPLLIPQLTRLFTLVLAQCMLIESSFGWPGIGRWLIDSVAQQDYNRISAGVIVIGLCIIFINTLNEFSAFLLDPLNKKGWYAR